ncbi:MAG: tetratricopeptide repeat protein [Proteobacteria bacterium]|nr:tetratricopeptide repeat protein [Pseudomonadota bacterium]
MRAPFPPGGNRAFWGVLIGTLAIIAIVYWPVHAAGLVWDDKFYLHDRAWLRQGADWLQIVLHGFPDWGAYFRPLGVASFTAQVRLFDTAAGPMHLVSLALHLCNTCLVGLIARTLLRMACPGPRPEWPVAAAMLLYGLHPALIESVAWISSQFDLLVTAFTLLGLLANLALTNRIARSAAVAGCFFFAACAKESAAAFPLLLFVVDWLAPTPGASRSSARANLRAVLQRQWLAYLACLVAGIGYLLVRRAGLGTLVGAEMHALPFSDWHVQAIGATYLAYWKLLVWPMTGLGPLHPWPQNYSGQMDWTSVAGAAGAIALGLASAWLLYRRRPLGGLMAGFGAALLPVLHLIPLHFDDSLYHERYATTAIAFVATLVPWVWRDSIERLGPRPAIIRYCLLGGSVWLLLAAVNIRATLPLWSNETSLWRWALAGNPSSVLAKDALLSTYVEQGDFAAAQPLADDLLRDARHCARCLLNVAFLALAQRDADRAATALAAARQAMDTAPPQHALVMGYTLALGNLDELRQRPDAAEAYYRAAIARDPLSPEAWSNLALLQARQGQSAQARKTQATALALSPIDARARRKQAFERALKTAGAPAGDSPR